MEKSVRLFLGSIAALAAFGLLVALGAQKVGGLFPAMDRAAWAMVVVAFFVVTGLSIRAEERMKLIPWRRLQESESLRESLAIAVVAALLALALLLLWPLVGPYIGPHFGGAVR